MKNVSEELKKLIDNDYRDFNKKLNPEIKRDMLGIKIPVLRKLAKDIAKECNLQEWLKTAKSNYFEEVILQGLVIGYTKMSFEDKIPFIKEFIPKIDGWGITDTVIPTLKLKEKDLPKAWEFILPYTKSEEEFDVRFAVIMMLDYFIIDEYVDEVIKQLDKINHDGYYAKMAVAWCLSEIRM